jgi:hypothetical protein
MLVMTGQIHEIGFVNLCSVTVLKYVSLKRLCHEIECNKNNNQFHITKDTGYILLISFTPIYACSFM